MTHQKIVPHLWFDTEAEQAFDFYKNIFPENTSYYRGHAERHPVWRR